MAVTSQANISLKGVSVSFDGLRAVSALSFDVPSGAIVALIGPNGAGKTTVFNLICGNLKADGGTISVVGRDVTSKRPDRIAALGVGRTFQDCKVFEQMTVRDNVMLGMRDRPVETLVVALKQGKGLKEAEEVKRERALELLKDVGLADKADCLACDLSYGQRKLIELSRVRAFCPQIFLLDEPFAGLFPEIAQQMACVICDIGKSGRTAIFIEHDMKAVADIADRAIVMNFGRLIADDAPEAVLNDPAVLDAYLGRE
ncbi:MAG: ABC transporter ATP-binding protein [Phycisphaerae bacterium]|jgi:ABC-type branched-subunit amino acid transport system ATPase component